MSNSELTLHLHDYSLFPYERDLAGREVTALVGKRFENGERFFRVRPKWSAENVWRLTYFSRSENGTGSHETLQHQLERSHHASKGRNHRRQSTRYSVHGLHEYKGKFNPQIAHALLNIFGADKQHLILDPFCGSGTSLVEAAHLGIAGAGFDMNPLAVFIANTKLAALTCDTAQLRKSLKHVAAALYARYLRAAFTEPYFIGYNRCQLASRIFQDGPPAGWKQGILDPAGEPYPLLLKSITTTNREVLEMLYHQ